MLILTNGLTDVVDEGFLKVANSLVKRLKSVCQDVEIVSYERQSEITDKFIYPNKFMSNKCIRDVCKRHDRVLYIPFPTKKWVMALRVFLLSQFSKNLNVVLVLKSPINFVAKVLLKYSKAKIIVFSKEAFDFYSKIVGQRQVIYLKTGVDTQKFIPVSNERMVELKNKYGFLPNKKVILHVGHLNEGRNLRQLMKIEEEHQVLLVTSTLTKDEADEKLKKDLLSKSNIKIIDEYIPHIEEIYQLSDLYFFPVVENGHCIDVPLSCMEAAACNKPVITTKYGEMKELEGKESFYFIESFHQKEINRLINAATSSKSNSRKAVLDYDWNNATSFFYD